MVKVCHLTSAHDSNDVRIFYKECVSLASAGYDMYLVAQGRSREEAGVHVIGTGAAPDSRLKRMTVFAERIYKKALEVDADIYHLHDPELLPYGKKLKKLGKKVIFDSHENTLEQMLDKAYIPALIRPAASEGYRWYATKLFKQFDALISVTPHIVNQLAQINSSTYMVTNYPLLEEMTTGENEKEEKLRLCFAGGISEQWSHETILGALAEEDNVEYMLCGQGKKEYIKILQDMPGWKNVQFYGMLPHAESLELQKKSDIGMALLQPSRNTGFNVGTIGNTKIFEYMLSGIPIICTNFTLWQEIIQHYQCGICVPPQDPKAVLDAIRFIQTHRDMAAQMGRNGRRAVEQEFNWSTQEKTLLELYAKLCGEM